VVLKELLDNALDAAEEAEVAPKIMVEAPTRSGAGAIRVSDSSPEFHQNRLERLNPRGEWITVRGDCTFQLCCKGELLVVGKIKGHLRRYGQGCRPVPTMR
jgi:hypothetical protein